MATGSSRSSLLCWIVRLVGVGVLVLGDDGDLILGFQKRHIARPVTPA
jgi:hypothetical protein